MRAGRKLRAGENKDRCCYRITRRAYKHQIIPLYSPLLAQAQETAARSLQELSTLLGSAFRVVGSNSGGGGGDSGGGEHHPSDNSNGRSAAASAIVQSSTVPATCLPHPNALAGVATCLEGMLGQLGTYASEHVAFAHMVREQVCRPMSKLAVDLVRTNGCVFVFK